ncbi:MAG: bifunctional UDP-N-acetylglucosamine diphosphorylase/glucosamine-1-phosphate N-acetyltransferase GlmU [Proteobacteria bacterium]|nr:bifunctional UDP-N-acetylglucosamine diphosphorylase/glucosamine-1-phosphate N-acetyltransferase GlmU [Pseudomonadota bacterium]
MGKNHNHKKKSKDASKGSSPQVTAIILAAGKGTRMKSEIDKVMHKVAGKTLVRYVVDAVNAIVADEVVAVIAPTMEAVRDEVLEAFPKAAFARQKERLGTGHAVICAETEVESRKGVTLILYGDTPFISPDTLKEMLRTVRANAKMAVCVLGFSPKHPSDYGRLIIDQQGNLAEIVEYKDASDAERKVRLCNSGVMAVRTELLFDLLSKVNNKNAKGEYYLTDIVKIARENGYICGVVEAHEAEVMGINNRANLAEAEKVVQRHLRERAMENGATLIDPETVFFHHDTKLGRDVTVHPFVVFGAGVEVADGVNIRSFTHIEKAFIDDGAVLGPYARIRPGSDIGKNAHIGNFVEIKKARVEEGAKINHLSYVGDAFVGAGANIGAGTITCNYDGYSKYNTYIGKGAFIGSDTALIAPVKVGEGAIVGAGTTVFNDVPPHALAINEKKQKIVKEYAKKYRKDRAKKKADLKKAAKKAGVKAKPKKAKR